MTPEFLLCLNSGSSSLKFTGYALEGDAGVQLFEGAAEGMGGTQAHFRVKGPGSAAPVNRSESIPNIGVALELMLGWLANSGLQEPRAVGHRFVHGGPRHFAPERVTPGLLASLKEMTPFAPLHLPAELEAVQVLAAHFPATPQVVCFDTAFHRHMPEVARRLALPRELFEAGIFKYGFHGLSYEYVVQTLGAEGLGRAVLAHLGNGASMAAVHDGRCVDTTMGLTPAGGFMMGTRSGDLDPGVLVHLLRTSGAEAASLERLVNRESGLLGVSGTSADMALLLAQSVTEPHAAQAVEMFCYQARKSVGALVAALGGLDTLVFTGGIGEHAAPVRAAICEGLGHLGVHLDVSRNLQASGCISTDDARVRVRVVKADEDQMIAHHTRAVLRSTPSLLK